MRQKDKQRNSEVMGHNTALESCRINHSPMVAAHSSIHPVGELWPLLVPLLCEAHPVSPSPSLTASLGEWLTGLSGENDPEVRALSCFCSCDKDTKWRETREIYRLRANYIISHRYRYVSYSFKPHLLYLLSLDSFTHGCAVNFSPGLKQRCIPAKYGADY